jgi:hypothetical protein
MVEQFGQMARFRRLNTKKIQDKKGKPKAINKRMKLTCLFNYDKYN